MIQLFRMMSNLIYGVDEEGGEGHEEGEDEEGGFEELLEGLLALDVGKAALLEEAGAVFFMMMVGGVVSGGHGCLS